jgi:hypothetical protein
MVLMTSRCECSRRTVSARSEFIIEHSHRQKPKIEARSGSPSPIDLEGVRPLPFRSQPSTPAASSPDSTGSLSPPVSHTLPKDPPFFSDLGKSTPAPGLAGLPPLPADPPVTHEGGSSWAQSRRGPIKETSIPERSEVIPGRGSSQGPPLGRHSRGQSRGSVEPMTEGTLPRPGSSQETHGGGVQKPSWARPVLNALIDQYVQRPVPGGSQVGRSQGPSQRKSVQRPRV